MSTVETFEAGFLHSPAGGNPAPAALALTHGAGSNCNTKLLVALAEAFAAAGMLVYRYNLPFRRNRPSGPPFPAAAAADREGIREAVRQLRSRTAGRILAGGHSYGGRQTTMAAAEDPAFADRLLLLSYPLHPPGKPEQLRTAHFPRIAARALFVHGSKDPFGGLDEMREALRLIPGAAELLVVENAGHDLGRKHAQLAASIVERVQPV